MSQTFEALITVAANGYVLEFSEFMKSGEEEKDTLVFSTAYVLGQWLDAHLPKPPGHANKYAAPSGVIDQLMALEGSPKGDY